MRALFRFLEIRPGTTAFPENVHDHVENSGIMTQFPSAIPPDAAVTEALPPAAETEAVLDWSEKVADEIVPAATEALSSMVETGSGTALNFVSILAILAFIVGVLLAVALFVALVAVAVSLFVSLVAAAILIPVLIVRSKKKKAAAKGTAATKG